ncbi:glycosyltransferase family 9 protein [candidate division KSB1 bacterium]|nr:glycosyltransferase family 9 protein [candidate division KSB1 bacterium]
MNVSGRKFKNIAVSSISGIGNSIFAVPMLRLLRKNFPEAKITLFVRFKPARALLDECPYVDEIMVIDYSTVKSFKSKVRLICELRRRKFDLLITAFPSEKREKNLFAFLIGAGVRISHKYVNSKFSDLGFLQSVRIPVDISIHDLEQNLRLLEIIGIDTTNADRKLQIWTSEDDQTFAANYIEKLLGEGRRKDKILVGFHAGSSEEFGMTYKRWGARNFARLGNLITEKYDAKILLFGGPEEKGLKMAIAERMKVTPVIVEKTSMPKDAAIMDYLDLFVSNDSGNMNLALAVGIFTIGLFGPVDSVRADLKNEQHVVINSPAHCSPCWGLANITEPLICSLPEVICMKQIALETVFDAADKYLSKLIETEN